MIFHSPLNRINEMYCVCFTDDVGPSMLMRSVCTLTTAPSSETSILVMRCRGTRLLDPFGAFFAGALSGVMVTLLSPDLMAKILA